MSRTKHGTAALRSGRKTNWRIIIRKWKKRREQLGALRGTQEPRTPDEHTEWRLAAGEHMVEAGSECVAASHQGARARGDTHQRKGADHS